MKRRTFLTVLFIGFFFLFDRAGAFLFRELNHSFYSGVNLKKNTFGRMEIIQKNFYNAMILGTSRTLSAIHPIYLYRHLGLRTYSAAKQDRYPQYFYLLYKKFREDYGKPDILFYGMDYFMFSKQTSPFALASVSRKKKRMNRINFGKLSNPGSKVFSGVSLVFRAKPRIDSTVSDVLYLFSLDPGRPGSRGVNAVGISTFAGPKKTLGPEMTRRPRSWKTFDYTDSSHGEGVYLRKLLDELETDGVRVFLVILPEYDGTRKSNVQTDAFKKDLLELIRGRNGFRILDYNDPARFDTSNPAYFKDGGYGEENSHLSYYGAIPLNRMLAADVGNILQKSGYSSHTGEEGNGP